MNDMKNESFIQRIVKSTAIAFLLYPLQRIQTIMQVQSTYIHQNIQQSKIIKTHATHYGIKSMFRGLSSYLVRGVTLLTTINLLKHHQWNSNKKMEYGLIGCLSGVMYVLLYPLQVVRVRMCADIERQIYYKSVSECLKKTKQNQGLKSLYRGLNLGLIHFYLQISATYFLLDKIRQFNKQKMVGGSLSQLAIYIFVSELLLYPLDTVKKLLQINGAFGHNNYNVSYWRALSANKYSLYQGVSFRLVSYCLYSANCIFFEEKL